VSLWATVLLAAAIGFAIKFAGYLVPLRLLDHPMLSRAVHLLPVALLTGLIAVQAFTSGAGQPVLDARAAAVAVAIVALLLRVPFLGVVILAGATAAALRAAGLA